MFKRRSPIPNGRSKISNPAVQPSPIPIIDPSQPTESNDINQQPDDTIKVHPTNPTPNGSTPNPQPPAITGLAPEKKPPAVDNADPDHPINHSARAKMNAAQTQQMLDKAVDPAPDSDASPEGTDYIFKNNATSEDEVTPTPAVNTKKTKPVNMQQVRVLKMHPASTVSKPLHIDSNGLFKLKSAVWVIQMGSFKNKENALHLVNKLRINGYRAFIQQVASYTEVFVGPENKQNSARALKNKLEAELHMSGIVISYKPLKL